MPLGFSAYLARAFASAARHLPVGRSESTKPSAGSVNVFVDVAAEAVSYTHLTLPTILLV